MSDFTPAQTRLIASVRRAATLTDRNAIRIADGLVALSASGLSVRAIVAALAGTDYPLGKTRVNVIVRTRKAHPGDDYLTALADATAANTGDRTTEPAADTTEAPLPAVTREPLTVSTGDAVAPVTLDALTDRLADLFEAARSLPAADLTTFLTAVDAEVAFSAPVVVTVPVAA